MKRNSWRFIFLLFLFHTHALTGLTQNTNDDSLVLSFEQYRSWVLQYHPIARQSALIKTMAKAELLSVKGNFDPKAYYLSGAKNYNDKQYYQYADAGVKMSTPFAVEWKAGYENNSGIYLNPESQTPVGGLMYTQISLPLLQGLLIDERRAALNQAKILQQLSVVEQQNLLNDLLLKSAKAYFEWQLAYQNAQVYEQAYQIAAIRYSSIQQTVALGDRPAIDTTEANIQLQDRWLILQQAKMELQNKLWLLSGYCWTENTEPLVLKESVQPKANINLDIAESLAVRFEMEKESWVNTHPQVQVYQYKDKQLDWDRKWKQDKLKPVLNVNYNPLVSAATPNTASLNNYKWGINASFPLLLRKERGALQQIKIKIEQNNLEWKFKQNEQLNKIRNEYVNFIGLKNQQKTYAENVKRYAVLLESEKQLFENGESSLFMINSREMSYMSAQIKQNELVSKFYYTAISLQVATGQTN